MKLPKICDKDIKSIQRQNHKETLMEVTAHLKLEARQTKGEENSLFKLLGEKKCQREILYWEKIIKNEGRIMTFSDFQKLEQYIMSIPIV